MYYYNTGERITDFDDWKTTTYHNVKNMKKDKKEYFENLIIKREISEKLHYNTDKIIEHFKVPAVIENPQTSYCWKFFHKEMNKEVAHYIELHKKTYYFCLYKEIKVKTCIKRG